MEMWVWAESEGCDMMLPIVGDLEAKSKSRVDLTDQCHYKRQLLYKTVGLWRERGLGETELKFGSLETKAFGVKHSKSQTVSHPSIPETDALI